MHCQVLVPLMLAVFFAKLVGDAFGLSVYDTHIKIKGAPVLVRMRTSLACCCSLLLPLAAVGRLSRSPWSGEQRRAQPPLELTPRHRLRLQPEADMRVRQAMVADKLAAAEMMGTALVALPPVVPLRRLAGLLSGCPHASFPVTEDPAAAAEPGRVQRSLTPAASASCLQLLQGPEHRAADE